jgi:hypothetical protein
MANWVEPTETDLAANLSQREMDSFRRDSALDGSDPVAALLDRTASLVRTWIASGGRCAKMGPAGTIPAGLVIPAMDYAMAKVLNRARVDMTEDRRNALRRAEEIFDKIARGEIAVENYVDGGEAEVSASPASSPSFAAPNPERLLD